MVEQIDNLLKTLGYDPSVPITNLSELFPVMARLTVGLVFVFGILRMVTYLGKKIYKGGLI